MDPYDRICIERGPSPERWWIVTLHEGDHTTPILVRFAAGADELEALANKIIDHFGGS